jgi:hypothetical protein
MRPVTDALTGIFERASGLRVIKSHQSGSPRPSLRNGFEP